MQIGRTVNETSPPRAPRETICEASKTLHLLHLIHETGQLVHHLLELFTAPLHGSNLVTHPHEHVFHLSRSIRRVLFGATVPVPLFHVDSPRDFAGTDMLAEREYAVHIVLDRRYVIAAHGDFTCDKDRRECLGLTLSYFSSAMIIITAHLKFEV